MLVGYRLGYGITIAEKTYSKHVSSRISIYSWPPCQPKLEVLSDIKKYLFLKVELHYSIETLAAQAAPPVSCNSRAAAAKWTSGPRVHLIYKSILKTHGA